MFDFEKHINDDVDNIAKTMSLMPIIGEPAITEFECYMEQLDYMLPKKSLYWRLDFKTNMYKYNLRHYIKAWLYLTPTNKMVIEFTVGDWRGYHKMMSITTLEQIKNRFIKIETQQQLDSYLCTFK